jgi:hypothetical protein
MQHFGVVLWAQPQSETANHGGVRVRERDQPDLALAFAAAQSDLVISMNPLPLQEFMPWQEFFADLHDDWPLQEFTPVHLILASSALAGETATVPNSRAAAVAIVTPRTFVVFIARSLMRK